MFRSGIGNGSEAATMNRKRGSTREPLSGGGVGDAGPDGTGDGDAVASQTDDGRLVHVAPVAAGGRPSTRDMLVAAAIGVAGSLVVVPLTYLQVFAGIAHVYLCLLYTSPSPRDLSTSRMPSSA